MIEVRVTDVFVRASKRLIKMYVSFKDDYLRLVADLESNTVHAIVKKYPCLPGNGWQGFTAYGCQRTAKACFLL